MLKRDIFSVNYIFGLLFLLFISSCSDDDTNKTTSDYNQGIFVVNQGAFPNGNGSLSYISQSYINHEIDVISKLNPNYKLGNVAQGMAFSSKYACITINNGAKADFFDIDNWEYKFSIENLNLPRYPYFHDSKWFITEWGATGNDGRIVIFSEDGEFLGTINTGGAPEKLLFDDDKIYVTLSNGYAMDNRVAIYNALDFQLVKILDVGVGPNAIIKQDDKIVVLSEGHYTGEKSSLSLVSNDELSFTEIIDEIGCLNLSKLDNDTFIFNSGSKIYSCSVTDNILEIDSKQIGTYLYGSGTNPATNTIFISDALDFNSQGNLYVLNSTFEVLDTFKTGVAPGQIYVK
jgi:DNA-binding beta-propeller fold protein YncE